jgi:hypothetical protein
MNDFTKKELIIIAFWGIDRLENIGINNFKEEGHVPLYNKIHSMIDTYTEIKIPMVTDYE